MSAEAMNMNMNQDAVFIPPPEGEQYERKEKQEIQQTSYLQSQVKVPLVNLPAPFFSTSFSAQEILGEGFQASISRISAVSEELSSIEIPELAEEARRDFAAKTREQEMLSANYQKEVERKTEAYRKQQEVEADKIRKELEKQHLRDVEFRKDIVEMAIENQKKMIDVESRYAKKDMDRERVKVRMMLEQQKFHSDIQVNLDSSAAGTETGGQVVSESQKFTERNRQIKQ
uniref:Cytosolic-abundant heat soluble protein 107838 n=1 Tax=Paramacrobiotus richtersi TaxID=697321 RepID=CAHS1_PARRC|nr:RecName: Full=Cytosolic-abundant heat soluble protein 107838; Short=CAHS 107838; AltName: Full=Tardigrade-specific intrinsically disordered protein CAHS 107838; Short=TDP CAHS 107838 [Paramacrobiotus richtersi]